MKYTAILKGKERKIEIQQRDVHTFHVVVDGIPHEIDARICSPDLISVLIDDHSYDVSFSNDKDHYELNFWNQYFNIQILDERKMRMRNIRSNLARSGPEIIKTSMPGKVVKILVEEGDVVESGTGIIIVEAMKMENEFQCLNPGTVSAIRVQPGQTVESDALLVEIEPMPKE
jgi:biotin carboxyl carrier protein